MNAGLRLVETEIVCVVNPDCLVDVATVRRGAELCTDDAVCAVPDFVDEAGVVTAGVRGAYTRRRLLADVARTHNATSRVAALAEHGPRYDGHGWAWPLGACVFLPAAALRRLGGFDEAYFLYMEDVDLGQRWCAAGGRIVSTGTTVRHAEQQGADVTAAARGHTVKVWGRSAEVGGKTRLLARLPLVAPALYHVVEVRDHAGRGEGVADLVEVDPPGVARALRENLKLVPHRVVPPVAGIELHAIAIGRARLADG